MTRLLFHFFVIIDAIEMNIEHSSPDIKFLYKEPCSLTHEHVTLESNLKLTVVGIWLGPGVCNTLDPHWTQLCTGLKFWGW